MAERQSVVGVCLVLLLDVEGRVSRALTCKGLTLLFCEYASPIFVQAVVTCANTAGSP